MNLNKKVNFEEFFDILMEVAIFGTLIAQKEMEIGYLIFEKDEEGFRYRVWVDDEDALKIEKYDKDDKRVQ